MRAYERLLKYAKVYTTSDPESGTHPSAAREFDLAHLLVEEMKSIGIEDAFVDEHCYVYGSIPATKGCEKKPALGLIAHMDTAPDASGENVKPILHENYDGGDVTLPGTGMVMKTSTFPFLKELKGETLITTDGTTLLGADDKSGVAEILTAAETLIKKKLPHGKLCIAFTPDEEIGEGASLFDIPGFGADFAYTVDGGDVGGIEYENFNAASATVTIHGFSVHPGSAKDAMINASNVAMEFHMALPVMARPETTEGYQASTTCARCTATSPRQSWATSSATMTPASCSSRRTTFSTSPATSTASTAPARWKSRSRTATAICWRRSSPTSTLWRRPARPSRRPA